VWEAEIRLLYEGSQCWLFEKWQVLLDRESVVLEALDVDNHRDGEGTMEIVVWRTRRRQRDYDLEDGREEVHGSVCLLHPREMTIRRDQKGYVPGIWIQVDLSGEADKKSIHDEDRLEETEK